MRRGAGGRIFLSVVGAALCSSCFSYRPVDLASVPMGAEIRLEVTREGLAALPEDVMPTANVISGRLSRRTAAEVVVRAPIGSAPHGVTTRTLAQDYQVDVIHVARVDVRDFSLGRTVALIGGGAGAVWLAVRALRGDGSRNDSQPSPAPPPESSTIPLFRLSWPR